MASAMIFLVMDCLQVICIDVCLAGSRPAGIPPLPSPGDGEARPLVRSACQPVPALGDSAETLAWPAFLRVLSAHWRAGRRRWSLIFRTGVQGWSATEQLVSGDARRKKTGHAGRLFVSGGALLAVEADADQAVAFAADEGALLFDGVGDRVAPHVVDRAFALGFGQVEHLADQRLAFDVVQVAGVGAGPFRVHAVGFELAAAQVDGEDVEVVMDEAALGVVEAAQGGGQAALADFGAGRVEQLAGIVGAGAHGVVADAEDVVTLAVQPGELGFDAVALAVEPDVADARFRLLFGDRDHFAEQRQAGGVDAVEDLEADQAVRRGAVGDVGALAVDHVDIEVFLDELTFRIAEGGPGLFRAVGLEVGDRLVEQGARFARRRVVGGGGQGRGGSEQQGAQAAGE